MTERTILPSAPRASLLGTRRELMIGGGMALAAGVAFALKPRHHVEFIAGGKIEALVPKTFAGWNFVAASGLVLPPQDQLQDKVYSQLLTRTYANAAGDEIMLLIAYNGAQDGVVQIHRPEVCYPASGFRLSRIDEHVVPLADHVDVPARFIIAETGLRREQMIYWTRVGNAFPRRWSEQRWAVFRQNLHGDIPDGLLVRISSISTDIDTAALDAFARDLYGNVGSAMKQVLSGPR